MNATRQRTLSFVLPALVAAAVLAVAVRAWRERRPSDNPAVEGSPKDAAALSASASGESFDLDAYIDRTRKREPGQAFDQAAHEAALQAVGPALLAATADLGKARQALVQYEAEHRRGNPERQAVVDALDATVAEIGELRAKQRGLFEADAEWRRLSDAHATNQAAVVALRRITASQLAAARGLSDKDAAAPKPGLTPELQAEVDRLRQVAEGAEANRVALEAHQARLAQTAPAIVEVLGAISNATARATAKQAELKASYAEDPGWKDLQAKVVEAEARQAAASGRVRALARVRMQVESEKAKEASEDGAARQEAHHE